MAAFASYGAAEARAVAKVADGTWINAFAGHAFTTDVFLVRVQRKMTPAAPDNGAWVAITDDATV